MNYKLKLLPLALLLLASCGQKQKAKTTIKDFVATAIAEPSHYSIGSFGRIDSTRYVTDSIMGVMRKKAQDSPAFRKDIAYGERSNRKEQLKYLTAKLKVYDRDTVLTFYLTNDLTHVVAFK